MTRWLVVLGLVLSLVNVPAAIADERGREHYSPWIADRPLTLPKWTAQVTGEVNVLLLPADDERLLTGFGFDLGLPHRLQIGAFGAVQILRGRLREPNVDAELAILGVNFQIGLHRAINLRFDAGYVPVLHRVEDGSSIEHGGFFALSLPWRVALHRRIALQGWQSSARAIGVGLFPDTLLTITAAGVGRYDPVNATVYVPFGLVVQPVQQLSLLVLFGYRAHFERINDSVVVTHYLPLQLGIAGHIRQYVDIGFTATIYGPVSGDRQWSDLKQFDFYVAGRF